MKGRFQFYAALILPFCAILMAFMFLGCSSMEIMRPNYEENLIPPIEHSFLEQKIQDYPRHPCPNCAPLGGQK